MKNVILILFVVMTVGLFVLGGCESTTRVGCQCQEERHIVQAAPPAPAVVTQPQPVVCQPVTPAVRIFGDERNPTLYGVKTDWVLVRGTSRPTQHLLVSDSAGRWLATDPVEPPVVVPPGTRLAQLVILHKNTWIKVWEVVSN